ncbi:MAG: hypothetical protein AB1449_06930 [Chloroflexota bacterium]
MSHQPFEDWLLDDPPLTVDEQRLLRAHLGACTECRALAAAWQEVEGWLHRAEVVAPAPGFVERCLARQEAERAKARRRQAWSTLAAISSAGLPLGWVLVSRTLALLDSPAYLALTWMEAVARLVAWLYVVGEVLSGLLGAARGIDPVLLGLGLVALMGGLGTLWLAWIYRFAIQGVGQ